jgi:hypothetical protein
MEVIHRPFTDEQWGFVPEGNFIHRSNFFQGNEEIDLVRLGPPQLNILHEDNELFLRLLYQGNRNNPTDHDAYAICIDPNMDSIDVPETLLVQTFDDEQQIESESLMLIYEEWENYEQGSLIYDECGINDVVNMYHNRPDRVLV